MRLVCLVLLVAHLRQVTSYGGFSDEPEPLSPETHPPTTTTHVTTTVKPCHGIEELGSPTGNNETFCNTVGGPPETRLNPTGPCYCAPPHARWYQPGHPGGPCTPSDGHCHNHTAPSVTPPPIQCGINEKPGDPNGNMEHVCNPHSHEPDLVHNPSPCTCVPEAARMLDVTSPCFVHVLLNGRCPIIDMPLRDAGVPSEPNEDKCLNKHDLCDYWARIGQCDKNRRYMERNCVLACATDGSCGQRSLRPYEFWNCGPAGKHPHCDDWVRNGDCKRNYLFMKDNCGRECATAQIHRLDPEVLVRNCLPDV